MSGRENCPGCGVVDVPLFVAPGSLARRCALCAEGEPGTHEEDGGGGAQRYLRAKVPLEARGPLDTTWDMQRMRERNAAPLPAWRVLRDEMVAHGLLSEWPNQDTLEATIRRGIMAPLPALCEGLQRLGYDATIDRRGPLGQRGPRVNYGRGKDMTGGVRLVVYLAPWRLDRWRLHAKICALAPLVYRFEVTPFPWRYRDFELSLLPGEVEPFTAWLPSWIKARVAAEAHPPPPRPVMAGKPVVRYAWTFAAAEAAMPYYRLAQALTAHDAAPRAPFESLPRGGVVTRARVAASSDEQEGVKSALRDAAAELEAAAHGAKLEAAAGLYVARTAGAS